MFKLGQNRVKWPVQVSVPQDGGTFSNKTFTAQFEIIPAELAREQSDKSDQDFLKAVTVGFSGIADENGAEVVFSNETLDQLIAIPYVRIAMVGAYFDMATGGGRRKN